VLSGAKSSTLILSLHFLFIHRSISLYLSMFSFWRKESREWIDFERKKEVRKRWKRMLVWLLGLIGGMSWFGFDMIPIVGFVFFSFLFWVWFDLVAFLCVCVDLSVEFCESNFFLVGFCISAMFCCVDWQWLDLVVSVCEYECSVWSWLLDFFYEDLALFVILNITFSLSQDHSISHQWDF
jgi:hypothetical protein